MAVMTKFYREGSHVFRQGDVAEVAYIVESGAVEISLPETDGKRVLGIIGPGEVFGEMGPVDGHPRSADARVLLDTTLLIVDKDQIGRRLEDSDPFVVGIFRTISRRLREIYGNPVDESQGYGEREALIAELRVERLIREGLGIGEFEPHFQPIVDMRTGETLGYECLARWRQADGSLVPPHKFIPLAERSGLIRDIDVYMLNKSCSMFSRHRADKKNTFLSINLSANHFGNTDIIDELKEAMDIHGLSNSEIKIEVTESALIKHPDAAQNVLQQMRDMGLLIALDDFGTGYSSLNYLHKYPIDILKIDRTFVMSMMESQKSERIVDAMIALALSLSLGIIAEGVETEKQVQALLDKQVTSGQGWLFGKPLPADEAFSSAPKAIANHLP